jgi:hypothetical protein
VCPASACVRTDLGRRPRNLVELMLDEMALEQQRRRPHLPRVAHCDPLLARITVFWLAYVVTGACSPTSRPPRCCAGLRYVSLPAP